MISRPPTLVAPSGPGQHRGRRRRPLLLSALSGAIVAVLLAGYAVVTAGVANAAGPLLSQGKPTTASSSENAGAGPGLATDGNAGTRWSSAFSDPQWIQVDLGATATIDQVVLNWEAAYARAFQLQVSTNGTTWTTVYNTTTGSGGVQTLAVSGTGRYVRMYGTVRGTAYGYSLWEFQVFGTTGGGTGCGTANAAQDRPATASSTENAASPASAAFDGNTGTRWSSAFGDPQWIQVDLGATATICGVTLNWEAAYASSFQIQTSTNGTTWTSIYSTTTGTGGTQTLTVSGSGRYVRMYGTARGTAYGYSLWEFAVRVTGSISNPPTTPPTTPPPDQFWGDTNSIPNPSNVIMLKILNRTNGRYPDSQVYWSYNGQVHSIAEQPYFDMPANTAGRMYFYVGSPNSQYYDFIEFTVGPAVFNGNTTRVDAFGLKLAMRLHARDGYDVSVGEDYATFTESREATFAKFIAEVPQEFKVLAQSQAPYRIIAPGSDPTFRAGGVNANYFTAYAQQYGINALTSDIFGCAGVLANDPGNCAALNRHVKHLPQAQWSTPSLYYQAAPANYYSKFWHDHAISKLAYGFPYDDYAEQSSFVSHGNPQWLLVAVGF
ncbi:discoidin domain-containing protein [Dactylosporangium fulvum]|uniref:Discoidin domain-containing protein n=2 Tax=Dactylosporangium fulvum TaxID=53359 RepID=A0ABY5WDU8_9ACTN|nr:discoidin domain-containing protein [Dactylosporangium fulvum]UWP87539.1 discoidin domain-containing protein [Dactylosporangium fulvum]